MLNYGTATLSDCTLSSNFAGSAFDGYTSIGGDGGGLQNYGTANLTDCTISGNSAGLGSGGGVFNKGSLTLTNCTLSGNSTVGVGTDNSPGYGGAVYNSGTVNLTDCTISGNSANDGGGLDNSAMYGAGTANLTDTIVAGNTDSSGASDIAGSKVSGSYNLVGTGGSGGLANGVDGNIVLTSLNDLGVGSLGDNGGPTQTMALLHDSAAIGAGVIADYPGTTTPITTDQRGNPLDSPKPDIGAYQTQGRPALIALTFSGISDPSIIYGTSRVTFSGTLTSGSGAPVDETVAVTLNGVEQSATIGAGGAFSTTFSTTGLVVAGSPYTVNYAYASDGNFAAATASGSLTITPTLSVFTVNSLGDAGVGSGGSGDLRYCINQANADNQANHDRLRSDGLQDAPDDHAQRQPARAVRHRRDADDYGPGRGGDHQRRGEKPRL